MTDAIGQDVSTLIEGDPALDPDAWDDDEEDEAPEEEE